MDRKLKTLIMGCLVAWLTEATAFAQEVASYPGYRLTWAEEFEGTGLPDTTYWNTGDTGGVINNESQDYRKGNLICTRLENGKLALTAYKDPHEGIRGWGSKESYHFEYSSGEVHTSGKKMFKYGRIDVSAKIPIGRGIWPAIWLMPDKSPYGGWPNSGEIDVMEYVWGDGEKHNTVYSTVHTFDIDKNGNKIASGLGHSATLDSEFHLYSLVWEEDYLDILFDNHVIFTFRKQGDSYKTWPFDQPFHLIMNIAVGGSWGGTWGVDESIFPKTMEVDYVRYYEKNRPIPFLKKQGNATQLVVDRKPMLLLAGELKNSTGTYPVLFEKAARELKVQHFNTLLVAVPWESVEQKKGTFNFSMVENLLQTARRYDMKLSLLWFGTWKNGLSSYAPAWVLKDTRRFERVKFRNGENSRILSPLCEQTLQADKKAFSALMEYLREHDHERTVVAIQIENEVGILGDTRDFSSKANRLFNQLVPQKLLKYMQKNKKNLEIELLTAWKERDCPMKGCWEEVFGASDETDMFFMAWQYAQYVNEVAEAGKAIYPLPMYVNCWMPNPRPDPGKPGKYPSGGPNLGVLDIWKAGAPSVDFLTPDIYGCDFPVQANNFHRKDNPLFVPETHLRAGVASYIFAEHDAICCSPFGLSAPGREERCSQVGEEYELLQNMMPLIIKYQGTGDMFGLLRWSDKDSYRNIPLNKDVTLHIAYLPKGKKEPIGAVYGFLIRTGKDEFIVAGKNLYVSAFSTNPKKEVWIRDAEEGHLEVNGKWVKDGVCNGDEGGYLYYPTPTYRIASFLSDKPAVFKFRAITYDKK